MKIKKLYNKFLIATCIVFVACGIGFAGLYFFSPSEIALIDGHEVGGFSYIKYDGTDTIKDVQVGASKDIKIKSIISTSRFLGVIPIKSVKIHILPDDKYIPSGMAFGIKIHTDGVLVVGMSEIVTKEGAFSPAYKAGIRVKDVVLAVNGKQILTNMELSSLVTENGEKEIDVKILREGNEQNIKVIPRMDKLTGGYKIGMWIRDSTAGIGTMTFYSSKTGLFTGLGHPICDVDTGDIMPFLTGSIVEADIMSVDRGERGQPGELKGRFVNGNDIGELLGNDETGIYGFLIPNAKVPNNMALPIALRDEIKEGDAKILSTIEGNKIREYSIKISAIYHNSTQTKDMMIEVVDPVLLARTGGIVQGMSGSPIIQNGKLVGAVTHVLVNDPTRGFGVFAENMIINIINK